ncbi:MAG: metallophosphoesterase [Chitinophagaceae bacterium]|nr:MAG: metallophosphoesterase [Chitinophagaceae bacterium]
MRKFLQSILKRPLTWMANKLAASPKRETVFSSLTTLYKQGLGGQAGHVKTMEVDLEKDKFIVFSDQHMGNKSWADDFNMSEASYQAALHYYNEQGFHFINLGDSEELWKFKPAEILPANEKTLLMEAAFHPHRYTKAFGNHDIIWKDKFAVAFYLKKYFDPAPPVYEGVLLKINGLPIPLNIFLTHGHQGDLMSDNNAVSTWLVAHVWMPMQRFLRINVNSASKDFSLRNLHNKMMYEWSSQRRNLLLVTGHTHKPVFASGRYYNLPGATIEGTGEHTDLLPVYFNTGCCCFDDGDVTGLEIEGGYIRLVKWYDEGENRKKKVLEEILFKELIADMR